MSFCARQLRYREIERTIFANEVAVNELAERELMPPL